MKHNMKMSKKNGQKKLLAAFAVLAMVSCIFIAIPVDSEGAVNETIQWDEAYGVGDQSALETLLAGEDATYNETPGKFLNYTGATLVLTKDMQIPVPIKFNNDAGVTITIPKNITLTVSATADVDGKTAGEVFAAIDATRNGMTIQGNESGAGTLKVMLDGDVKLKTTSNQGEKAVAINTKTLTIKSGVNLDIDVTAKADGTDAEKNPQAIYGIRSSDVISIGEEKAVTTIDIDVSTDDRRSFGIYSGGPSAAKDLSFVNVTGTIDAGNRAIQAMAGLNFNTGSDITLTASERAVKAGTITIGKDADDQTKVVANLTSDIGYNGGKDERFGIIAVTSLVVNAKATLQTMGLEIDATVTPTGIITVSGDYTQNPDAKIPMRIAGLYNAGSGKIGTIRIATISEATTAGNIYLIGDAETYGNVTVTEGEKEVQKTESITDQTDPTAGGGINAILSDENVQELTIITSTATKLASGTEIIVPIAKDDVPAKTLTLVAGGSNTFTGTVAIAKADGTAGDYKVVLTDFVGSLRITEGSAAIEGDIASGKVVIHESATLLDNITVNGKLQITGDLTTNGKKITLGADGKLILGNGTDGVTLIGSLDVVGTDGAVIAGKVSKGTVNISGKVEVEANEAPSISGFTIGDGAKLVIEKESTLDATTVQFTNEGTVSVYGTLRGNDSPAVKNNGTIVMMDKDATVPQIISGTGTLDTSAISSDVDVAGDIKTVDYPLGQTVTITKDSTIKAEAIMTVMGTLVIDEGATLTIEDGGMLILSGSAATMINNGTIVVKSDAKTGDEYKNALGATQTINKMNSKDISGGLIVYNATLDNNGIMMVDYEPADDTAAIGVSIIGETKLNNAGSVVVSAYNEINGNGTFNNAVGASIEVYGKVAMNVKNSGSVKIDGSFDGTVYQIDAAATVEIISTIEEITVSDEGLVLKKGVTVASTDANSITMEGTSTIEMGSVMITSSVTKDEKDKDILYNNMFVSGSLTATNVDPAVETKPTGTASIAGDRVYVDSTLTISEGVTLEGESLIINGEASAFNGTMVKVKTVTILGTFTVGMNKLAAETVNGSVYVVKTTGTNASTTYYYSTLEAAIAGASAAGVKAVDASGTNDVQNDLTIPAGMTVTQTGVLTIAKDKTLTVAETAKITQTVDPKNYIEVKGTLYIEDKKTGISKNIDVRADVKAEGEKDLRYTSLANSIAAAGTNEVTIKLNREVVIDYDLTIPENITVDTVGYKLTIKECTVTIEGMLFLNGSSSPDKYVLVDGAGELGTKAEVIVDGYMKSDDTMTYDDKGFPAGVYYEVGLVSYITSLDNAPNVIADAEDQTVFVYGDVSAGDLTFAGTEDKPFNVIVKVSGLKDKDGKPVDAEFGAGDITLTYTTILFETGKVLDATIAGPTGSVEMSETKVGADKLTIIAGKDSFSIAGAIDDNKADGYAFVIGGEATVGKLTAGNVDNAKDGSKVYSITIDGTAKIKEKNNDLGDVKVNGTLVVPNKTSAAVNTIVVLGTVSIAAVSSTDGEAGELTLIGAAFVGLDADDVGGSVAGDASISGAFKVTDGTGVLFVAEGSTIPSDSVKDLVAVKYVVEDKVWMTAYATKGKDVTVNEAPVSNAKFNGWKVKDETANETQTFDGNFDTLVADIEYDIYEITLLANEGIADVFIDGNLMQFISMTGQYMATVSAGTHEIEYTLKNGYSGEAKLTVDGVAAPGNTFVTEGEFVANEMTYNLQLTGIEKSGYTPEAPDASGDSGMSLTEILLIVLVVLILIMAIIVAMRLMRPKFSDDFLVPIF